MDRHDALERLHALAHYINDGGDFDWTTELQGHAPSIGDGRMRITVTVDDAKYWRKHTDLAAVRSARRGRRSV